MLKIYTKKGDTGSTALWGGDRVPKDDLRIRVYGTLDELNSGLGVIVCEPGIADPIKASLLRLQAELFQLGAELATPRGKQPGGVLIESPAVEWMEKEIDSMEESLSPLKTFILPGGTRLAALIHFSRTVSRRAERELISLHRAEPQRSVVLQYFNRLSDYLFVLARYANHIASVEDTPWNP